MEWMMIDGTEWSSNMMDNVGIGFVDGVIVGNVGITVWS
jgi:hypothetical protein